MANPTSRIPIVNTKNSTSTVQFSTQNLTETETTQNLSQTTKNCYTCNKILDGTLHFKKESLLYCHYCYDRLLLSCDKCGFVTTSSIKNNYGDITLCEECNDFICENCEYQPEDDEEDEFDTPICRACQMS